MLGSNNAIDNFFDKVFNAVLSVLKVIIDFVFSNNIITFVVWAILINLLAIFLMKKDKKYAQDGKWRIKESTLLLVALVGGAAGMYYAMHKYRHKTLHKKFTILVPTFIVLHIALIIYLIVRSFIV